VASNYQQTIVLNVDKRQLKAAFKELGLVQKRIQKINQTGLQLNRVRSRARNIQGTGLNLSTNENRQAPGRNPSARVKQQTAALNKANAALNKYVRTLSTADGAQRGFIGSANKMSTQVSALRDRLRGLARSNSEYRSTLQAVQRGEQALFQDRNKRLRDQANSLGRSGEKGGTGDLVTSLLNEDVVQSIDGLNNYASRLNALRDIVKINSTAFDQLSQKIVQVNEALEKTQFKKVEETTQKRFPQTELGSPQEFQQRQQFAEKRQVIEEQTANITKRINDSKLKAVTKEKLLNDLKRSGLELEKNQFKVAKQINIETQKNLLAQEKLQARRERIMSSTLIGGGFPLLFGGGPLQAAAGALGGNIGERATPGGGFAGSIAATAAINSIQQFAEAARQVGNSLKDANLGLEKLEELGYKVDASTRRQVESLLKVGKVREAENLVNQRFAEIIGPEAVRSLINLDTAFDDLQKESSKLFLQLSAELAPTLTTITQAVTLLSQVLAKINLEQALSALSTGFNIFRSIADILEKIPGFGPTTSGDNNDLSTGLTDLGTGGVGGTTNGGTSSSQDFSKFDLNILNKRIALQKEGSDLLNEEVVRKKQALIIAERALAIAQADGNAIKIAIAERTAELKTNELNTAVDEKRKNLIDNTIGKLQEEKTFLEERLTLGEDKAEIEKTIRDLVKDLPPERHAEVRALVEGNEALKERNKILDEQKATQEQIKNILAQGMTDAVMGLIDGSRTLGQVLAGVAKQLASMFLNKAFSSIFGGMFGGGGGGGGALPPSPIYVAAQGGFSRSGGFKAFQSGGVVNSPTMGMIGEGGESEYVIPASKMSGAMSRYSAGARGGAVIPGGSGDSGTVAGSSGNTVVEYTGPTLNFNGDEYVPKSAVPEIIGAATKQGAMAGKAQTFNALKNSRSQRASLGL